MRNFVAKMKNKKLNKRARPKHDEEVATDGETEKRGDDYYSEVSRIRREDMRRMEADAEAQVYANCRRNSFFSEPVQPKLRQPLVSDYDLLECRRGGSRREVLLAYRKMAVRKHPDKGGTSADFLLITDAKDRLLECVDA